MSRNRTGAYVPDDYVAAGARRALPIHVTPERIFVENAILPLEALGFDFVRASNAARAFARRLFELSHAVGNTQPVEQMPLDDAEYRARLDESLRLSEPRSQEVLDGLRQLGAPLRSQFSKQLEETLRRNGFPAHAGEEPALTFTNYTQHPPVLWDMMYEGGQAGDADWQKFWGFRVPITHWTSLNRIDEIQLRGGLFAAVNEDRLPFAVREVAELKSRLGPDVPHSSLSDVLRERVRRALLDEKIASAQVDEFLSPQSQNWLHRYLEAKGPHECVRWKRDNVIEIFKDPHFSYDLLHFACHCESSRETEFLSRLDMRVGGEYVTLSVGELRTDLGREEILRDEPGPLVFLNACGTGQENASHEPPGFPNEWITGRGALAVIGTLCPVPDYFAHSFALKFYEYLLGDPASSGGAAAHPAPPRRRYLAEGLLETRRHFMAEYNNPLGLAYVLYATKGAYVVADITGNQ
jgi:hypothetical protein